MQSDLVRDDLLRNGYAKNNSKRRKNKQYDTFTIVRVKGNCQAPSASGDDIPSSDDDSSDDDEVLTPETRKVQVNIAKTNRARVMKRATMPPPSTSINNQQKMIIDANGMGNSLRFAEKRQRTKGL